MGDDSGRIDGGRIGMHHGAQVKVHAGDGSEVEGVDSAESVDGVDEARRCQIRAGMPGGVAGMARIAAGFGAGGGAGGSAGRTGSSIADQNGDGHPAGWRERVVRMLRMLRMLQMLDAFRVFALVARPLRLVAVVLEPDLHLQTQPIL